MMKSEKIKEAFNKLLWLYAGIIITLSVIYFIYPEQFSIIKIFIQYIYDSIHLIYTTFLSLIDLSFTTYANIYLYIGYIIIFSTAIMIINKIIFGKENAISV